MWENGRRTGEEEALDDDGAAIGGGEGVGAVDKVLRIEEEWVRVGEREGRHVADHVRAAIRHVRLREPPTIRTHADERLLHPV